MKEANLKEVLKGEILNLSCTICGSKAVVINGMWRTTKNIKKLIGEGPGFERLIAYGLCKDCAKTPDFLKKIENIILASLGASVN